MSEQEPLLAIRNVSKSFVKNGQQVFAVRNVSLSAGCGQCLGLVGESGCGKSTVASLVAGFLKPDEGEIIYRGQVLPSRGRAAQEQRSEMQMIFQNPEGSLNPYMTVRKNLFEAVRYRAERKGGNREERARLQLSRMGLPLSYLERFPKELSGGECQRVAIARALMSDPQLLLCDEITSALDVSIQAEIMRYILRLRQEGLTMLFITHDLMLAAQICDRIAVMYEGEIVDEGETRKIMAGGTDAYTGRLAAACQYDR